MEPQQHYAYNQTREAFLGMNVTFVDQASGPSRTNQTPPRLDSCESIWFLDAKILDEVGCYGPCDRIYLDEKLNVVALQESAGALPGKAAVDSFASVLVLPMHTIFSSQTQSGDQILIGTIEDIGAILNGAKSVVKQLLG